MPLPFLQTASLVAYFIIINHHRSLCTTPKRSRGADKGFDGGRVHTPTWAIPQLRREHHGAEVAHARSWRFSRLHLLKVSMTAFVQFPDACHGWATRALRAGVRKPVRFRTIRPARNTSQAGGHAEVKASAKTGANLAGQRGTSISARGPIPTAPDHSRQVLRFGGCLLDSKRVLRLWASGRVPDAALTSSGQRLRS